MRDDALRALPLTWSPLVLCCNMDILDRIGFVPPERFSRDDLIRLVAAVDEYRSRTGENIFSFPCTMLTYYRWLPFIWQDGCDIFYSENYDQDALWKSVDFLRDLYQAESCFVCPKMLPQVNEELFARGNFAFAFICSFYLDYMTDMGRENNFRWHLFEFPAGERRITSITSLPFTVSTYSGKKTEAVDLYRKLLNKKVQLEMFKNAGFLPVAPVPRAELRESVSPERFVEAETFFNTAVYGRSPSLRSYEQIGKFSQHLGMYFSKLITLDELKKECCSILSDSL
jgi:ABC-type glycerol-3-phosphate transport system substrate-binding protein